MSQARRGVPHPAPTSFDAIQCRIVIRYAGSEVRGSVDGEQERSAEAPSRRYSNGVSVTGSLGTGASVIWLKDSGSAPLCAAM